MANVIGIIPARYNSSRLPGKPLIDICGKPMIQRVWEAASTANRLSDIFIATDDIRILNACSRFTANCILTPSNINSGSDRIWEAYRSMDKKADIIVNIQGDEPLIKGSLIDEMIENFDHSNFDHFHADVATIIKKINNINDLDDPSIVKVALGKDNFAIYFSRSPIPFLRDFPKERWLAQGTFFKHIGIYAYRAEALERFIKLPQSKLELSENLEQLRLLEDGAKFLCLITDDELIGVDTQEDLLRVKTFFERS